MRLKNRIWGGDLRGGVMRFDFRGGLERDGVVFCAA